MLYITPIIRGNIKPCDIRVIPHEALKLDFLGDLPMCAKIYSEFSNGIILPKY
ncbi:MAG: hypothetical protein ACTSPW_11630 [Promethearchaeota archaeon]